MPSTQIAAASSDQQEWAIAKDYFAKNPDETKLRKKDSLLTVGQKLKASFLQTTNGLVKLLKTLGQGGYGKVKKCENEKGELEAIKVMHSATKQLESLRNNIVTMKGMFLHVPSRFALTMYIQNELAGILGTALRKSAKDVEKFYFRMPLLTGPNMLEFLEKRVLRKEERHQLALDCAIALDEMHQKGYIHGDVKCENIIIEEQPGRVFVPKIIDYDLSFPIVSDNKVTVMSDKNHNPTYGWGKVYNMAPEVVEYAAFSVKGDVYGLATVFKSLSIADKITWQMNKTDPNDRPDMKEIISHMQKTKPGQYQSLGMWEYAKETCKTVVGSLFGIKPSFPKLPKVVTFKSKDCSATFSLPKRSANKEMLPMRALSQAVKKVKQKQDIIERFGRIPRKPHAYSRKPRSGKN